MRFFKKVLALEYMPTYLNRLKKILEWGGGIGYNECVFDKNGTGKLGQSYTFDKK